MFLTDNLWTIFEVAKEYREKDLGGVLGAAPDIYLNALKGNENLECVQADPEKLAASPEGYLSAPHVMSIFEEYYPWVVTIVTPVVFCAVSAAIAVMPNTPLASMVFKSA